MPFISDHFLLNNRFAVDLFEQAAVHQPIIDYHCHLDPADIAQDLRWDNITQVWLKGDHYKWRAMRSNGVHEDYCTGDKSDRDKFRRWAETVPQLLRNPLYHWTHLELSRYFDVTELLNPKTANEIWERTQAILQEPSFSARGLIKKSAVELICTTDDPIDTLEHHRAIARDDAFTTKVYPTWRPDRAMAVECAPSWNLYVDRLAEVSGVDVSSFTNFLLALEKRHRTFHDHGCRLSDHGIEKCYGCAFRESDLERSFLKLRSGHALDHGEREQFKSGMMFHFARMDAEKNWTQQIHYGALRNNNRCLYDALGPDVGFDSIDDVQTIQEMAKMFNLQHQENALPKTIIYNLNPSHNECVATMLGNFQDGCVAGKMQMGSGWWFMDQKDGMERQMECLSQLGLLSRFVGMLTDSRSFLSYTRHEYFRRVLCNLLGRDMEKGLIPNDMDLVGQMVANICYHNAKAYFQFPDTAGANR